MIIWLYLDVYLFVELSLTKKCLQTSPWGPEVKEHYMRKYWVVSNQWLQQSFTKQKLGMHSGEFS